jgi:hypothetical protein
MTAAVAGLAAPQAPTAWDLFRKLLPAQLLNDLDPKAPQAAYTPWVVTWLMIFQRLNDAATLNDAVSEFISRFEPQMLPDCQRAQQHRLSANSGAYSLARTKLDSRVLYWAAQNTYDSLSAAYPPSWGDRRVFTIDGSTIQLQPTQALRVAFPPASNQYGPSPWPVLHLAVAHELASGLAVLPEYGPMYGPQAKSELTLARGLLPRLPKRSILLADRNFGVFAFAWAAVDARHDALLRLTQQRFEALRKKAQQVGPNRWQLTWRPSARDRQSHPELPQDAEVSGWLHTVAVSEQLTLYLFTTLEAEGEALAGLYHKRQDVETDIRDLKETLLLGELSGKSVAMVEKELLAALLAYNLANQVRRLAAERLKLEPRRLSFAGTWSLLKAFVAGLQTQRPVAEVEAEFERLLRGVGQRKLPRRAKGRSYPREALPRGRKFPTRKRDQNRPPQVLNPKA